MRTSPLKSTLMKKIINIFHFFCLFLISFSSFNAYGQVAIDITGSGFTNNTSLSTSNQNVCPYSPYRFTFTSGSSPYVVTATGGNIEYYNYDSDAWTALTKFCTLDEFTGPSLGETDVFNRTLLLIKRYQHISSDDYVCSHRSKTMALISVFTHTVLYSISYL